MFGLKIVRTKKDINADDCVPQIIDCAKTDSSRPVERWEIICLQETQKAMARQIYGEQGGLVYAHSYEPSEGTLYDKVAALTEGKKIKKVLVDIDKKN